MLLTPVAHALLVDPALLTTPKSPHRLRDNPQPYEFPFTLIGARPTVLVTLNEPPPPQPPPAATHSAARLSIDGGGGAQGARRGGCGGGRESVVASAELTVAFERLLVGKRQSKGFTLSNTGVLPVKWRLAGAEALPPELRVSAVAGELPARTSAVVAVELSGAEEKELLELLRLEVGGCCAAFFAKLALRLFAVLRLADNVSYDRSCTWR